MIDAFDHVVQCDTAIINCVGPASPFVSFGAFGYILYKLGLCGNYSTPKLKYREEKYLSKKYITDSSKCYNIQSKFRTMFGYEIIHNDQYLSLIHI